jgi:hypothetical protein
MDMNNNKLHFGAEHREFVKDVTGVIISYTPISGVVDTIRFGQKWLNKKKMPRRFASYVQKNERKSFIKSRSRRIRATRKKST